MCDRSLGRLLCYCASFVTKFFCPRRSESPDSFPFFYAIRFFRLRSPDFHIVERRFNEKKKEVSVC